MMNQLNLWLLRYANLRQRNYEKSQHSSFCIQHSQNQITIVLPVVP